MRPFKVVVIFAGNLFNKVLQNYIINFDFQKKNSLTIL